MDVSQLIGVWVAVIAVLAGGIWRVVPLLVRIANALEAVPGLVDGYVDLQGRVTRLEERTP